MTLIESLQAAPGKADALVTLLQRARDLALTADGCEGFELYQAGDDPYAIVIIERWTTVDAQQAYFEADVKATGVLDAVLALIREPPEPRWYAQR